MAKQQHWLQCQLQKQNQKIDEQQQMMTPMMEQFRKLGRSRIHQEIDNDHQPRSNLHFNPKIEFPGFDGHNPREWIKKCTRYFSLCKTADDQKVDLATLHFVDMAEKWFASYIMGRRDVSWEEFIVDVYARFWNDVGSKVIEEFNKL